MSQATAEAVLTRMVVEEVQRQADRLDAADPDWWRSGAYLDGIADYTFEVWRDAVRVRRLHEPQDVRIPRAPEDEALVLSDAGRQLRPISWRTPC